ncbi:MAG: RNA polymerase sigma factor [Planctomycetes bacterium]|nr:RNA polymerase sigma factor [Planctomycetota bacterium]
MTAEHRDWDFSRLVEEHFSRAVRFCARMLGNVNDGEEVAQQAFVSLYEKGHRPWEKGDPLPFLFRVLRNACVDHVRRGKVRRAEGSLEQAQVRADLSRAEEGEIREALLGALAALDEGQREVVLLRYFEELSLKETAEAVGKTVGATAMLLSRAKQNLKESLGRLPEFGDHS